MSPARFILRSKLFCSAEQALMAEKAFMFSDKDTLDKILGESDPVEAKKLGRRIRNYNEYVWQQNCLKSAAMVNLHKFHYNDELRDFLLSTGDKIIVEANSKDCLWGTGLDASSPDIIDPRQWKGLNNAGFALMMVRDMLRDKYEKEELTPYQIVQVATNNLSSINKMLNGEDSSPRKKKVANSTSWETRPLTKYQTVKQNFYVTEEQMEIIRYGHIPEEMGDHWFMYADEKSINYFRSWTGICIIQAFYQKTNEDYVITKLRINSNRNEYLETNINKSITLFYALLLDEFGGHSQPYWNAHLSLLTLEKWTQFGRKKTEKLAHMR